MINYVPVRTTAVQACALFAICTVASTPVAMPGDDQQDPAAASPPPLPSDLILCIFGFVDVQDLCSVCSVSHHYNTLASDDFLWERHCRRRWRGKQNVERFADGRKSFSWKERYRTAEDDGRRVEILRDEVSYFRWKLVYNGVPSNMGLRHFRPDGIYESPYLGMTAWNLHHNSLVFSGLVLPVERNERNWGWMIGRGSSTVYHSVELAPSDANTNNKTADC